MTDYTFASATELVRLIKTREISSAELLDHYLERVDQYNGPINAVIAQNHEKRGSARKRPMRRSRAAKTGGRCMACR